jgi:hypothetical protein
MATGQGPNFRGQTAVNTSIAFSVVATCFVTLRCVSRLSIVRSWFAEDLVITGALLLSVALTVLIYAREYYLLYLIRLGARCRTHG